MTLIRKQLFVDAMFDLCYDRGKLPESKLVVSEIHMHDGSTELVVAQGIYLEDCWFRVSPKMRIGCDADLALYALALGKEIVRLPYKQFKRMPNKEVKFETYT